MPRATLLILTLLVSGCGSLGAGNTVTHGDALCRVAEADARAHSRDLVVDGGTESVVSGDRLIRGLAAACGWETPE